MTEELVRWQVDLVAADYREAEVVVAAAGDELAIGIAQAIVNTHPHLWTPQPRLRELHVGAEPTNAPVTPLSAPREPVRSQWVTFKLTDEDMASLEELRARTGQSRSAVVRDAVAAWLIMTREV